MQYALPLSMMVVAAKIGVSVMVSGQLAIQDLLRAVPILALVIACPGTGFGVYVFHILRRHEYPYYRNLGATGRMRGLFVTAASMVLASAALPLSVLLWRMV